MQISLEEFSKIPNHAIFAKGAVQNSPNGLYLHHRHIGREIKRVAVKGGIEDFSFYIMWGNLMRYTIMGEKIAIDYDYIATNGDKISDRQSIQRIANVSDEVMKLYRS